MCWQADEKLFGNIIIGEYYNVFGKHVKGIYTTVADDCVVANINVIDKLTSGVKVLEQSDDFTLEQAEDKFGKQIIERYLSSHGVLDIFSLEEVDAACGNEIIERHDELSAIKTQKAKENNLVKAREARSNQSQHIQATIIKAVLEGCTKQEIEYKLGYCRTTINKALRGLDEDSFKALWLKYREIVFENVDRGLYADFITCKCDYKLYMEHLKFENSVAFRKKVDKQLEVIEADKLAVEHINKISEGLVNMGYSPVKLSNGVEASTTLPEAEEIDLFDRVVAICSAPVEEPVKKVTRPVETETSKMFADYYYEKMHKKEPASSTSSTSNNKFRLRTKAGIVHT